MSNSVIARDIQQDLFNVLAVQIETVKNTIGCVLSKESGEDALASGYLQLVAIENTVEALQLAVLPRTASFDNEPNWRNINGLCLGVIKNLEKSGLR